MVQQIKGNGPATKPNKPILIAGIFLVKNMITDSHRLTFVFHIYVMACSHTYLCIFKINIKKLKTTFSYMETVIEGNLSRIDVEISCLSGTKGFFYIIIVSSPWTRIPSYTEFSHPMQIQAYRELPVTFSWRYLYFIDQNLGL